MSVRRLVIVCVLVFCSISARAAIEPSRKDTTDSGCVVNGSTAACFSYDDPTSTAYDGPTILKCAARSTANQRCRACQTAYFDNGQSRGYQVCAYVAWNAGCGCNDANTSNCRTYGECSYLTY
jgi:hypothetical protein